MATLFFRLGREEQRVTVLLTQFGAFLGLGLGDVLDVDRVMMTAHQKGACVIAVYVKDVAETKAKEGTELGKQNGYPLFFTTEPEE